MSNKNIEVIIPGKLAAVKYSFIPFISEIDYTPDPAAPAYTEPMRITAEGVLLLNKEYKGWEVLRDVFKKIIPLSDKQLKRRHAKLAVSVVKRHNRIDELCMYCIEGEQERRQKEVKQHGNN